MRMINESKEKKTKSEKTPRSASAVMRRRAAVSMTVLVVMGAAVAGKLFKVSIVDNSKYETLANNYHFGTMTLDANRGAIYDANGTALAWSATVYNIYVDPKLYRDEIKEIEKSNDKKKSAAEEKGEQAANLVDVTQLEQSIVSFLSEKLEIDASKVQEALAKDGRYCVLQTQVEKNTADEITTYFDKLKLTFVGTEATTRRYYPQNELAAAVIGFTNGDGDGQYGLEYQYDEYLSGVDGRIISAQAANGEEMPYRYSTTYEAKDGASLYLTLDSTMQYYLEKSMSEMVEKFEVNDRATGIIMNPKTGAIYAMATCPSFDLNNPSEIYDPVVAAQLKELPESEYQDAYLEAREKQWRNKAISEINPPGSTIKIFTSASAFEENLIDLNNDSFYCSGSLKVQDLDIGCSLRSGHGAQTFTQALTNSCNPAFMEIGLRLGVQKFSYYLQGFGLTEKTGIDLPGEVASVCVPEDKMTQVDLASGAFGQTNETTALELITAYAAAINGGYVVQPYVVDHIVDSSGNTVLQNTTTEKRQIISEETSKTVREQLEAVVSGNPSHNAYIQGYRIGGKTGTSQKLDQEGDDIILSFYGFAPADDPEIAVLVMLDEPQKNNQYGSVIAAPVVGNILADILPYLGFEPNYTEEQLSSADMATPYLINYGLQEAQTNLVQAGLQYRVVGNGTTVVDQTPGAAMPIPGGGTVVLYTEETERQTAAVPYVIGKSGNEANRMILNAGFNIKIEGESIEHEGCVAVSQSIEAGENAEIGTVITVTFEVQGNALPD